MLRKLLFVVALAFAGMPLTAQIRTIGGGATACCSAATITPIDSIRFTGTTSAILGGAGNMTITAGTGNSRTMTLQTTTSAGTAKNVVVLGADSSATFLGQTFAVRGSDNVAGYAFASDPNTGMYSASADNVQLTAGGAQVFGGGTTFSALYVNDVATVKAFADRIELDINGVELLELNNLGADTLRTPAKLVVSALTAAAGTPNTVCINATTKELTENAATSCVVSSIRYKKNVIPLTDVVAARVTTQLKPVTFTYKDGGRRAIGLIAEQADSVDTRLTTRDARGRVNAVNYEQVTVILLKQVQTLTTKLDRMCKAGVREAC